MPLGGGEVNGCLDLELLGFEDRLVCSFKFAADMVRGGVSSSSGGIKCMPTGRSGFETCGSKIVVCD